MNETVRVEASGDQTQHDKPVGEEAREAGAVEEPATTQHRRHFPLLEEIFQLERDEEALEDSMGVRP